MMTYELSSDFSKIKKDEYLDVYDKQSYIHQDYFHHPYFQYTCLSVFSYYEECFLFSVFKDGKLIGYCAFKKNIIKLKNISYSMFLPVGYRVSEYNYPIIDFKFIDDFFKALYKNLKSENIFFPNMPSFFARRFLNSFKNSFTYGISENPILKNFDQEFFNASKKKGIVRDFKQLSKEYEILVENKLESIKKDDVNTFFDMHIERWDSVGVKSKFTVEKFRNIYTELIDLKIDGIGSPVFNTLKADGSFIAMHYGFLSKKRFIYQIPVYNVKFKTNKSPGSILLKGIFEFNIKEENKVFDMGTGLENYKYRFMNHIEVYANILYLKNPLQRLINRIDLK